MVKRLKSIVYRDFLGIDNTSKEWRNYSNEDSKGGIYLRDAKDVDIDPDKQVLSRAGYLAKETTRSYRNLYPGFGYLVGVVDGNLSLIYPSRGYTITNLLFDVGNNDWTFVTVDNIIYCSNNIKIGFIFNESWYDFSIANSTLFEGKFPPCYLLAYYNSQLYGAKENYLIASLPTDIEKVDIRQDRSFIELNSCVTMLAPVDDGIWVSDEREVFFLKGSNSREFIRENKLSKPAISGSAAIKKGFYFKDTWLPVGVMFATSKGLYLGKNGGELVSYTEQLFAMPSATKACSVYKSNGTEQYILILK